MMTIQKTMLMVLCVGLWTNVAGASPLPPNPVCAAKVKVDSCDKVIKHPGAGPEGIRMCTVMVVDAPGKQGCGFKKGDTLKDVRWIENFKGQTVAGTLEWGGDENVQGYQFTPTKNK
ncbi:MAG: hypothetical protein HQL19_03960 [Candidatus Omnitrophica bacterium]|nr:hypothetical protein [Candidatus Omnitrophota bacterium]